jgi:hypothetical protein
LYIEQEDYSCQAAGQKYNGNFLRKRVEGIKKTRLVETLFEIFYLQSP